MRKLLKQALLSGSIFVAACACGPKKADKEDSPDQCQSQSRAVETPAPAPVVKEEKKLPAKEPAAPVEQVVESAPALEEQKASEPATAQTNHPIEKKAAVIGTGENPSEKREVSPAVPAVSKVAEETKEPAQSPSASTEKAVEQKSAGEKDSQA